MGQRLAPVVVVYSLLCLVSSFLLCAVDASKSGVAQETMQNTVRRASKVMTEQEARQILGVTEETPWEEVAKVKYLLLFTKIVLAIYRF